VLITRPVFVVAHEHQIDDSGLGNAEPNADTETGVAGAG
jgi:hypothetical protein